MNSRRFLLSFGMLSEFAGITRIGTRKAHSGFGGDHRSITQAEEMLAGGGENLSLASAWMVG